LKQRDAEVFQLVDQWTRSLKQEVAERKEAERALQASQEFVMRQERLAAVGQLAAGLAHEFNNIMTIIQGHTSLLMENPNLDEDSIRSLAIINDGVERTARLVKQMLAFSRKQVMQRKPLDVKETLGHTAEMLGRLLGEHVRLDFEIAPRLPAILADPEMFQQIVVNLVVNARDAMSSGGQLTIRADLARFTAADIPAHSDRRIGPFVRLSVSDTGSGMNTAIINRLFEPFFTTKDIGKGSGLGLATVHGMVNQHEGWIEVESQVGKGTTFDIYFPVTGQVPQEAAEPSAAPEVRGGKETVLMVEDELVLRELVREILQSHGYRVLEAANGLQALQVWDQNRGRIDLLLTDVAMPDGMSGRDLASKLRQEQPRLPVIFSSGYSQEMLQNNEAAGPGVTFLSKPYRPLQLAQAVRDALDAAEQADSPLATPAQRM
jgi:signal transduction histidine kinase/ActR/RegA family two-component response regulator